MNNPVKRLRNAQIFVTNNMREYPPPPKEKKSSGSLREVFVCSEEGKVWDVLSVIFTS